ADRLSAELRTIGDFGFESYFLTVADVVQLIQSQGIRAQARGSGAGSLVNYLLGIGSIDPIAHSLVFERFLGAGRCTLPDIDVDVESARRPEIYRDIVKRYGEHSVVLLSMHNTYRTRSAVRDAGLALGVDGEVIDRLAKSIWRIGAKNLRSALSTNPELRDVARIIGGDRQLDLLVDLVSALHRLPRHISMHPCGIIIGNDDLLSLTPVQPSGMGLPMSQFDKDDIDDLGLLKLDILGVRMQSTLAHAVGEIARVRGVEVDLAEIPTDDPETFKLIRSTQTLGVFQLESPGQRELIGRLQPDRYSDLIADISLFRPGPMQANMIQPFIDAKHGVAEHGLHPRFQDFLADSYGVVIYHEHVLRILADCMDISLAAADALRRRLGKEPLEIEQEFRDRARNRYDDEGQRIFTELQIDAIWKTLESFGAFGFCKAHAASFAVPTYQSAWLKTHYPAEFLAGILEHDPGMYPRRLLVSEARRLGVPILGLDVNESTESYRVQLTSSGEYGIRLSFGDVQGISQTQLERICAGQPYASITDFQDRAQPSRPLLTKLATVGAFDGFGGQRGDILAHVRRITSQARRSICLGQLPLPLRTDFELPTGHADPSAAQQIQDELSILGTEVKEHALSVYQPLLEELEVTLADQLLALPDNTPVRVAGIRVATQTPPTRSGQRVVFITLDDGSGAIECTFFGPAQERSGPVLFGPTLLAVSGRTRRTGERGITISAELAADLKVLSANRRASIPGA
ncbi:MAG: DNA polymerase III subunit alpha, partial [Angustibacter sp.]